VTSLLDDADVRRLRTQSLTYREVGQTAGDLPAGFHPLQMTRSLGTGREVFAAATSRLMTWRMHEGSGLTVRASSVEVCPDGLVVLGIRLGPLKLVAPCRVVYVVDDDHRRGFAYGTLPGHPESGEEAFIVEIADDEEVTATIKAFSRPVSLLARAGGPLTHRVQVRTTQAYLDALTD
jgi:uncharacterized protein (UPF0548 family)